MENGENKGSSEEKGFFFRMLRKKRFYDNDSAHASLEAEFFENESKLGGEEKEGDK